jgi:hypothetical protein
VSLSPTVRPAGRPSDRLAGALVFLPVPLVLWLFTRQPLGPWASLGAGVLLVLTHRLYARPFALLCAGRRCLWCGGPAGEGPAVVVLEPFGTSHADLLTRTLGWAADRSRLLAVSILGSLALFLCGAVAAALGRPAWLEPGDPVAALRLGVALAVLPFGWLAPASHARDSPSGSAAGRALPFPVHVQALLGTLWVVWLFRLVGLWWLVAALVHISHRLA